MALNVQKNYTTFKYYLKSYVKRDGVDELIAFLDESDAATCPASTKYHLSCEGGLIQHSLNVFNRLIKQLKAEYGDNIPYSKSSIAVVALLHDISKVNFYKQANKNVKDENGKWTTVKQYVIRDDSERLIFGTHEENSLHLLQNFITLTYDEQVAILYHMGSSSDTTDEYRQARMLTAYKKVPLAFWLYMADMTATCVDEVERKEVKETTSGQNNDTATSNTEEQVPI